LTTAGHTPANSTAHRDFYRATIMVKISFLLFASSLAVGWGIIIAWGLVWASYGFWWGVGAATLSLLAAVRYVLFPFINRLERGYARR